VYFGTDYSGTGLTCAHCHASAPHDADMRLYIAHTAYGAAVRGAWWVRDAEQLKTGQGDAPTLSAAAQRCIDATYMNVKPRPLSPADSAALEAYLHHIANDAAPDSKPFVRALARAVPSAALRPDKGNGKGIYLNSCTLCHGVGLAGIPQLNKLKTRLTPQQVMAKVRGLGDAPASDTEGGFAAGGMPAYSTDILSDQQVTDVAYYICEDL
jgi:mono/diheme cytochrome c family protein